MISKESLPGEDRNIGCFPKKFLKSGCSEAAFDVIPKALTTLDAITCKMLEDLKYPVLDKKRILHRMNYSGSSSTIK